MASRTASWFGVATLPFVYRLILREEANLLNRGDSYRRYFETVRGYGLPGATVPAGGAGQLVDGFTGETFIWSFAIGMAYSM